MGKENRESDAILDAWFKGAVPKPPVRGPQETDERIRTLVEDILAVQDFTLALSKGDLSRPLQVRGVMAGSLKTLQANLRHLTWQTQAVAKGDFSQRVDFMGDFSASFNAMVVSLAEMRQALEEGKREIEKRVEERTAQLNDAYRTLRAETEERERVEDKLRQAQKLEALGTLAGGIAHDFNNILAGIVGFTEIVLEQTPEDAPTRRKLELILKSGQRGRELVKQILTFSRRAKPEKREINISAVLEESLKLLAPILPRTVEIRKSLGGARETIWADQVQLHQVIMNLCTNAAASMQEKGGLMEIGLSDRQMDKEDAALLGVVPGPYVELFVRDTGCGIRKEMLEKIFDPFFTTKKSGQGTGMGLSVVHGIVKGHGGAIAVESEPGTGSAFRVYLPAAAAAAPHRDTAAGSSERNERRILFVDDEETLVEMNLARLRSFGYQASGHSNPEQALAAFRQDPQSFDLVITDYAMPRMNGIDLAKNIHELRPDVPILLFSGFNEALGPGMLENAGISALVEKTVNKRDMAALVKKVLKA